MWAGTSHSRIGSHNRCTLDLQNSMYILDDFIHQANHGANDRSFTSITISETTDQSEIFYFKTFNIFFAGARHNFEQLHQSNCTLGLRLYITSLGWTCSRSRTLTRSN